MHLVFGLCDRGSSRSSEVVCVVMYCRAVSRMGMTEKEQQVINRGTNGSSMPALMAASRGRSMVQFGEASSQDDQNDDKRSRQDAKGSSGTC
jgi:hypothetical protein